MVVQLPKKFICELYTEKKLGDPADDSYNDNQRKAAAAAAAAVAASIATTAGLLIGIIAVNIASDRAVWVKPAAAITAAAKSTWHMNHYPFQSFLLWD